MPLRQILLIMLLGNTSVALGQASYVDIIGPSTRSINEAGGFEARFYNSSGVWVSAPTGELSYDWYVGGGPPYQVNSESKLNANIQWSQAGTATLEYSFETWDNFFIDYMDVVISAPAPPPPQIPLSQSPKIAVARL